jgi:uncharacterized protein (DUF433 family)
MSPARRYKDLIWQTPDRVSGAVCFYGTRLPVQHIEEFCQDYNCPIGTAKAVLELAVHGIESFLQVA